MSQPQPGQVPPPAAREPVQTDVKVFLGLIGTLVLIMAAVAGVVILTGPRSDGREGFAPKQERRLADFRLTDRTGREVARADAAGKFLVVNFVFTSCSVSCLLVNQQMAEVQRLTAGQPDVQLLSLTVDPRTDTPPVLAQFAARFGADTNRWLFLTGDKAQLYGLIETSFLAREPFTQDSPMPGGFAGTERIALVDRTGRVRRYFDGMKPTTPAALTKLLGELRAENPKP
jgi:protein SCO1